MTDPGDPGTAAPPPPEGQAAGVQRPVGWTVENEAYMHGLWQECQARAIPPEVMQQFTLEYAAAQGAVLATPGTGTATMGMGLEMAPITAKLSEFKELSLLALAEHKEADAQIKQCDKVIAEQTAIRKFNAEVLQKAVKKMKQIQMEKKAFTANIMAMLDQSVLGEEAGVANKAAVEMDKEGHLST
ncbi:hypothetical protein LPJ60_006531 [Coemansia sp. RSA 2675]|nr:hypothetical protein LPJ60_006531 [Coemansia sp. RSA 2675]